DPDARVVVRGDRRGVRLPDRHRPFTGCPGPQRSGRAADGAPQRVAIATGRAGSPRPVDAPRGRELFYPAERPVDKDLKTRSAVSARPGVHEGTGDVDRAAGPAALDPRDGSRWGRRFPGPTGCFDPPSR